MRDAPHTPERMARRGAVYALVLIVAMLLTVMALAGLSINRVNGRSAGDSGDWAEAQVLAYSGVEHAMAQINADANWRTTYATATCQKSLGHGSFSWHLVDEIDGNLADNSAQPFAIFSTGVVRNATYTVRAHMTMGATVLTKGITVPGSVSLSGSTVDSYDSSLGAYGGSNVSSQAGVSTNATAAGSVSLVGSSSIRGGVNVGVGGAPGTVITKDGTSTITGATGSLSQAVAMPVLTAPAVGASQGWRTYTGSQTDTISGDVHLQALEIRSNAVVRIQGNVTIVVDQDVLIWNKTGLTIMPNSSLKLYFNGNLSILKSAVGSVTGANLSRMQYINTGTCPVVLGDGSSAQGVIVSPNAPVRMSAGFQFYGAIVAQSLSMTTGAGFHEDKNITGGTDGVSFGGGKPKPDAWSQVID